MAIANSPTIISPHLIDKTTEAEKNKNNMKYSFC